MGKKWIQSADAVFSLVDSQIVSVPMLAHWILHWLLFPTISALFICPFALIVCVLRTRGENRVTTLLLEVAIIIAHLFALLPAVQ